MQIDKDKLQKLLSLNDDDFREKVTEAVISSNLGRTEKENFDKALQNVKDIKKALGSIDEESLKKAIDALGADKITELRSVQELKKTLKK